MVLRKTALPVAALAAALAGCGGGDAADGGEPDAPVYTSETPAVSEWSRPGGAAEGTAPPPGAADGEVGGAAPAGVAGVPGVPAQPGAPGTSVLPPAGTAAVVPGQPAPAQPAPRPATDSTPRAAPPPAAQPDTQRAPPKLLGEPVRRPSPPPDSPRR